MFCRLVAAFCLAAMASAPLRSAAEGEEATFSAIDEAFHRASVSCATPPLAGGTGVSFALAPRPDGTARLYRISDKDMVRVLPDGISTPLEVGVFERQYLVASPALLLVNGTAYLWTNKSVPASVTMPVPPAGKPFDPAPEVLGFLMKTIPLYEMRVVFGWEITFLPKDGTPIPLGMLKFGQPLSWEFVRAGVAESLKAKVTEKRRGQKKGAHAAKPAKFIPKKRTVVLYDRDRVLKGANGITYVPRVFKASSGKRQAERRQEWQQLYDEAVRQETEEAEGRAAFDAANSDLGMSEKDLDALVAQGSVTCRRVSK